MVQKLLIQKKNTIARTFVLGTHILLVFREQFFDPVIFDIPAQTCCIVTEE